VIVSLLSFGLLRDVTLCILNVASLERKFRTLAFEPSALGILSSGMTGATVARTDGSGAET
jgi:hypothetical protein